MVKGKKDHIPVQSLLVPKYILNTGKILDKISPLLASRFGARLFMTPFRYKVPNREKKMFDGSNKENILIDSIDKEVVVYTYGNADKKILLVHGWSGTGTQLSTIAQQLVERGYGIISFDAPAHGRAPGKISMMPYFIDTILQLDKTHGPFEAAVGHSLGGMALLRASKFGVKLKKLVIIGTANSITSIINGFAKNMELSKKTGIFMKSFLDKKFGEDLNNYSGAVSARDVTTDTLVIHDKNDVDVACSSAIEIDEQLQNSELFLTEKLGHRKILGNRTVINKISDFITS